MSRTRAKPGRLTLIYGDDEFRVRSRAKEIVEALCPADQAAMNLEIVDGDAATAEEAAQAVRKCLEGLNVVPWFGGTRVVWLRDVNFFRADAPTAAREAVEQLTDRIRAGLPEGAALVISALKVDGRLALLKVCREFGSVEVFEKPERPWQQAEYAHEAAEEQFARHGLKASPEILEAFVERVGSDTRQIAVEAEKLAVYLGDRRDVRIEDIAAIVCRSARIPPWDLADAVTDGDLSRALAILRQLLAQGEEPIGLAAALETRFRDLIVLREALDRGWARVVGRNRLEWVERPEADAKLSVLTRDPRTWHPYRAAQLAAQAAKWEMNDLRRAHAEIVAAQEKLVSSAVPAALQLEWLLVRLLSTANDKARSM